MFFKTYFLNPKNKRNINPKTNDRVVTILSPEESKLTGSEFCLSSGGCKPKDVFFIKLEDSPVLLLAVFHFGLLLYEAVFIFLGESDFKTSESEEVNFLASKGSGCDLTSLFSSILLTLNLFCLFICFLSLNFSVVRANS